MALPDLNLGDVAPDPDARNLYERAMTGGVTMPPPPPVDHPVVQFAQKILAPLNQGTVYGQQNIGSVPKAPPFEFQRPLNAPSLNRNAEGNPYIGPDITQLASDPNSLFGRIGQGFATLGNAPLPPLPGFGQLGGIAQRPVKVGDIGGMFAPPSQEQSDNPLFALGPEGNFAGNLGEAVGPVARLAANKAMAGAEGLLRPGMIAAAGKDAERFVADVGNTRSFVVDTVTGKKEPTTFIGSDHAAKAQAAADKLNAQAGTADAGIAVSPEAGIKAALGQLPDAVETAVRRQARLTPNMTPADMVAAPTLQGQLMQALAKAKMPASDENMATLAQSLLDQEKARPTIGNRNATLLRDTLAPTPPGNPIDFGPDIPKPINVPLSTEQAAANAGTVTNAQTAQQDILRQAIAQKEAALAKTEVGPRLTATSPNATSLPLAPVGRNPAKALALGMLDVTTDLPRAAYLVGHLPLLRQGLPMMADAFLRGSPSEIPQALGRTLASYVASDAKAAAMTNQFRGVLADAGASDSAIRKLVSDIHGPLSAREDYTLNSALANFPGLKQLNRGFPMMMNSLRVGMALDRVKMAEAAGQAVNWTEIADQVAHLSGKGDLPGTPGGTFQTVLSRALFGPKLLIAPWQVATDTIKAVGGIGSDLLSRRALNTNDISQVRAVASYVLTGAAIMQIAQKSGLDIETNADSRDWGRIALPDGSRVDLWGAYGPDARLVMQTLTWLNETQFGIGTPLRPQKFGANNAVDMLEQFLRNKLGPGLPAVAADVLTGKTGAGKPFSVQAEVGKFGQDPLGYLGANVPRPLALEEAQKGGGGVLGAIKTGLVEGGATVVDSPRHITYDGLGAPEGDPNYRTGSILDTYALMVQASQNSSSPWHGGDPIMPPPPTTIGRGANELQLDPATAARYVAVVGDERNKLLGPLVNSQEFQALSASAQQDKFDATRKEADKVASERFLATQVVQATDPKEIAAEAVDGFLKQTTNRDRAYWVALLDRAGKLTPDVSAAIDGLKETLPGDRQPITVEEYRKYAPLAHEYLSHVPYGTDKLPLGTPADWSAVAQAKVQQNVLRDQMIRSGVNPSLADVEARQQTLQGLGNMIQRSLFLNGASLVNQQRKLLAQKYGTNLTRFVSDQYAPQESESQYQNPYGQ